MTETVTSTTQVCPSAPRKPSRVGPSYTGSPMLQLNFMDNELGELPKG